MNRRAAMMIATSLLAHPCCLRADGVAAPLSSTASVPASPTAQGNGVTDMADVQVVGKRGLSGVKYRQALVDIPQTVVPITREVMQEQAAYSLGDALRNAPSVSAGAGDPGSLGDRVRVRGFADQEGFFADGLRDFGTYYRDPFDLEELDVLEGPSGLLFGMGATGGSLNQVAKQPGPEPLYGASLSLGSAQLRRATADLNQPLGTGAALRVAMLSDQGGVPGRDVAQNSLGGAAVALGFGLGTPLQLTLGYFHLDENSVADMGLPWLGANPAPIPYRLYYGFGDDYLKTSVDRASLRLQVDAGAGWTLTERAQFQAAPRSLRETIPAIANPTAPLGQ
ncbi:MAG TPA: TonB-dependent receptor plug domain-containing protein, partial [bacterium]|nr:TonB-dependent receptor plug domain-containing protein [bacterium]